MKNNHDDLKIYVIGTGFSSLTTVLYLLSKEIKPVVIDIATNYSTETYNLPLLKPYFYKKRIENYSFFGGLSNVWKGVIQQSSKTENDHQNLQHSNQLFKEIYSLLPNMYFFTNKEIKSNVYELRQIKNIEEVLEKLNLETSSVSEPIILSGKDNLCVPYKTSSIFQSLIEKKKIELITGEVISIGEENQTTILFYKQRKKIFKKKCKYVFCGAGALSSTSIIQNTLKISKKIKFESSNKHLFISIFKDKKKVNNSFPIYQGKIIKNGYTTIYLQTYLLSQLLDQSFKGWKKKIINFLCKILPMKNLAISYVSTDSDNKNNNFFKLINNINKEQNFFKVIPIGIKLPKFGGNHFGSSFDSNTKGNIKNIKNFSVIDTTTLSKIYCTPPTLTLLMHSLNITKKVLKELYPNNKIS